MNVMTLGMLVVLAASEPTMDQILDGIRMVESSGGKNLVGDKGKAIGPYQIWEPYWEDGTRILKVKWPYKDAYDENKARQVVRAYINHYGKGHGWEGMIRVHNGGPTGWKKKSTLEYLNRVKQAIADAKK